MANVFCDYLDVTCRPDMSFLSDVSSWLDKHCYPVAYEDSERVSVQVGSGMLALDSKKRFHRASASGAVIAEFRSAGIYDEYLMLLSSVPHKVTRLDAAIDVPVDAPVVLRSLEARYPDDRVNLTRKALKVTRLYSARESDGQQTGTWYVGHRSSARVTARVYDKQAEALDKRGEELPPTTRYELTFKKDLGCTLKDASMPASLFFEYASPALVTRPKGMAEWVSNDMGGWVSAPVDTDLTLNDFRRRVEQSPEVARLAALGAKFGDEGTALVMEIIQRQLKAAIAT